MEVLEFVTRRVQDQSEWLTIMHFDEGLSKELVANLVDCLEISPKASDEDSPNLESTGSYSSVCVKIAVNSWS